MRFHKLEMTGFKSFADKTSVTFEPGLTAVVGPNGCGKSNISDGIRWVLGEKSAKNMRGEKMEDVIFNGTEVRKPTGMAEINLTLQDVEGADSLGFSEFKEITITRRLYRSGESEYLINKIPCRLKDIRDLLMDTGVGSRAYSIIEQGKIGQIITSKPEERRFIIEEVAGITKYKSRKTEALGKLKETEDNLSRVSDIIHEVKRQIGSLDRQAKKAERYKKLSSELRGLELNMAWVDYGELLAKGAEADKEREGLASQESAAKNAVSAREADLSETRLHLAEKERALMEHQREVHRLESEVSRLEARAEVAVNQLKNLDEREERRLSETGRLQAEEQELQAHSMSLREEEGALKTELDSLRARLQALEAEYQAKVDSAHALEQEIECGRVRLFDVQAELAAARNNLARLEERKAELETRSARGREERLETEARLSSAKIEAEKKKLELQAARASFDDLQAERETLSVKIDGTRAALKELSDGLAAGRERLSQKSNRLKSLKELEESLEGLTEGVKALVSEQRRGAFPGIKGLIADILSAMPEHERAIEAGLGDRLQNIIVGGHEDAKAAIAFLKARGAGRGSFIPSLPRFSSGNIIPEGVGIIGMASSLVEAKEGYKEIIDALLGGVLVVQDLDSALAVWEAGVSFTLATLDGEVIEPSGTITGGAGRPAFGTDGGRGILARKREIRELADEVESLSRENQAAESRLSESRALMDELEGKIKEIHEIISEKRVATVALEKDSASFDAELERITKKLEVLDIEASQRSHEEDKVRESITKTRAAIDDLSLEKDNAESALFAGQERLKAAKSELERDREALTARKIDLSALIQKHESWARDLKRADLKREELERRRAQLEAEGREISDKKDELTKGRAGAEASINSLMTEAIAMKEKTPALQDAYQESYDAIGGLEESVKSARRDAEAARDALGEIELRRAELKLKIEHLFETVEHNYHIQIPEMEEEIKALEIEREQAEMDASELRIKLEKLGPVNVGAIEEYNELMERFEFLSSQKQDLESSVARLREAIGKINKTSEELFMDAFNAINETFKTVFLSLFGGGRAELQLVPPEEGSDVLDSGLEIVAQPPGKKLQSLLLCSGGEKALIAAALVFACFLVKPSPFCVLDEVDAPLDENNVQRFGNMLKDFAGKTQFIVITHSRPTMELADALYGVTMDEPGVSRLVSVRLKEAAEMAGV